MPELPEVETIVRGLRPVLVGKTFQYARVMWARSLATPSLEQFTAKIIGQSIRSVERRGKFIVILLDRDCLLVHLRMSGDLRFEAEPKPDLPHDRIIFVFEDKSQLAFNDTRKFGRVWLVADPTQVTGQLGPEPLDNSLTVQEFHIQLSHHHRKLKPLLLDQAFLAGLGNIYTDEALFLAGLHPELPADALNQPRAGKLLDAIRTVLEEGIRHNGASIDWVYRGGGFQNHFKVYQRTGQPCQVCDTEIERIVLGQRGTHFCPVCQAKRS